MKRAERIGPIRFGAFMYIAVRRVMPPSARYSKTTSAACKPF
jgi:hypothetical protein